MQYSIQLKDLCKTYGAARGVDSINLDIPEGSVVGFLGPNGAGKTTTISMLVNLTRPSGGSIRLFGEDANSNSLAHRRRIGFLAGDMALDGGLTGRQLLAYFANLRGGVDPEYTQNLVRRLHCTLDRKIKTLSRGNRQKIALVAALMHQPDLLILDEPTSGLDPLIQAEFNKIILEHKQAGKTAFISSHVLSEVQELCDRIVIIREGRVVADKAMGELLEAGTKQVRIVAADGKPIPYVTGLSGVANLQVRGKTARFTYTGEINDLIRQLGTKDIEDISIEEANLEAMFMQYYEGDGNV